MSNLNPQTRQRLMSAAALFSFFLLWELACRATGVSDLILPRPTQIAQVLWTKMPLLWPHTVQTLYTTLTGFALGVGIGIVIGVIIGSSKLAYDVAYPLLVGFSSTPRWLWCRSLSFGSALARCRRF
jgi:NitT/TauT family transport system permease protein